MRTLVVGAGAAGLWCALHAAERGPVTLVAPDPAAGSSTALAQGGIAAAVAEGDAPAAHAADTVVAGAGLSDPEAVRILTEEAPDSIRDLLARGMIFDAGGAPTLEGGHSARRVLHAGGDATGWALLQALLAAVRRDPRVVWLPERVSALLVEIGRPAPSVVGISTRDGQDVAADRVVLATGGATGIFGRRTGPDRATGEGMALAWEAGAWLADVEFVQFHPTALDVPGHPARLLTEALRGEGAELVDADGVRFMSGVDARGDLAPRDIVARAIAARREASGRPVYLDATGIPDVDARFPTAARTCREAGLDIATQPIPVAPAAHYFIGGVLTDHWGRTSIRGLFACGEVACTGVHGANRLASNSLLEALVFGRRAAVGDDGEGLRILPRDELGPLAGSLTLDEVRLLADRSLGVNRDGPGLEAATAALADTASPVEARPEGDRQPAARLIAWLVAGAALRRTESRGAHFRTDHTVSDPAWLVRQAVAKAGWSTVPVAAAAAM